VIYGAGWLGGIGFTMSLFIADLAFGPTPLLPIGKLGILAGSVVAGVVGSWVLSAAAPTSSSPQSHAA
jgi:NhaA family Na+:H+ antiporter